MIYQSKHMRRLNAAHMGEGGIKSAMLDRYHSGMSYEDLAEFFEMPAHTIGYYMRRFLNESQKEETTNAIR